MFGIVYGKRITALFLALVLIGCCFPGITAAAAESPYFTEQNLFTKNQGGYTLFRIPGIVVTGNGTVIAYCEARAGRNDRDPMDILMRRSLDGGSTWQSSVKLADGVSTGDTINNPLMVAEKDSGTVHFFYCFDYSKVYYRKSTDHGATWSSPVEMTGLFNGYKTEYDWVAIGTGPGHGIQLSSGRLLIPCWFADSETSGISVVTTIYSDDSGATWHRGGILHQDAVTKNLNEPVAVELADGSVMMNIRNSSTEKLRAVTTSATGIGGWSAPVLDQALYDPTCFGSIARLTDESGYYTNRLIFSNINNPDGRSNLTVRMSMDEGETWAYSRPIASGRAAYSDLAVSADRKTIFCLYEKGQGTETYQYLTLARFNLEWLTNGEQSLDPLSGPPVTYPQPPETNVDEHWNSLSAWTTGGGGSRSISPAGQLKLSDATGTGVHVDKNVIEIPQSYTLEFKAKITDFTSQSINNEPNPTSLGTKVRDGVYMLKLELRADGIYATTNFNAWAKVKDVAIDTGWHAWKVVVNHGMAQMYMDGQWQCRFPLAPSTASDHMQHSALGTSADAVSAQVEYTRLYTGEAKAAPVGRWRLNESSGSTAADSSGNGNNGAVIGAVWAAGYQSNGLRFDGVDDYVDAGNLSCLQFGKGDFTAAAWVKPDAIGGDRFVFWYGDVGNDKPQWWLRLIGGDAQFAVDGTSNPGSNSAVTASAPFAAGQWTHVAVTRSGHELTVYINGVKSAGSVCTNVPDVSSTSGTLTIGRDKNGVTRYWDGMMDEVVVYDRALSGGEVYGLYLG